MADGSPASLPTKWRYAATAAATLAAAALRGRDAVSLTILGGRPGGRGVEEVTLPASAAAPHLAAVCGALGDVEPGGVVDLPAGLGRAADRFGRRGTVVILSDLLGEPGELHAALARLSARGYEPAVLRVLAPAEVSFPFERPRRFAPLGGGPPVPGGGAAGRAAYRAAFESHAAALAAACRRRGVPLTTATTDQPLAAALGRLLART